jgi:hypothetical protein
VEALLCERSVLRSKPPTNHTDRAVSPNPQTKTAPILFVEQQAAYLTHEDIVGLASRLPILRKQIPHFDFLEYPRLAAQCEFIALKVEDCGQLLESHLSDVCCRELAFALIYLEAEGDVLPGAAPGIGLIDDQAIVETVLYKHREALRHSPRGYLFEWAAKPLDFDCLVLDRLHHRLARARLDGVRGAGKSQSTSAAPVADQMTTVPNVRVLSRNIESIKPDDAYAAQA